MIPGKRSNENKYFDLANVLKYDLSKMTELCLYSELRRAPKRETRLLTFLEAMENRLQIDEKATGGDPKTTKNPLRQLRGAMHRHLVEGPWHRF